MSFVEVLGCFRQVCACACVCVCVCVHVYAREYMSVGL